MKYAGVCLLILLFLMSERARAQDTSAFSPQEVLRSFRKLSVRSGTVYMKNEQMRDALQRQPEFTAWGLETVNDPALAELILQVNRPFLTFDWEYKLTDPRTSVVVDSGKVSGFDGGIASFRIAAELMQHIGVMRSLPATEKASAPLGTGSAQPSPATERAISGAAGDTLRQFKTVWLHSTTVYLREELLKDAFQRRPEFDAWGLRFSPAKDNADLILEVNRSLFTFDWTYKLTERRSSAELLSGKVVSWDGKGAASKLAASIVELIRVSRPAPSVSSAAESPVRRTPLGKQSWVVRGVFFGSRTLRFPTIPENQTDITLTLTPGEITIPSWPPGAVKISTASVVAIAYDRETINTGSADAYWRFWNTTLAWDNEGASALVMAPIVLSGAIIPELQKKKQHNVSILFQKEGKVERARFWVPKRHQELLAALQSVTGVEWVDLSNAAKELKKGPEAGKLHRRVLLTDRELQLGRAKLPAGKYTILLLEKRALHGEIYVLSPEVGETAPPLTRAEVEIEWVMREHTEADSMSFSLQPGTNNIGEIVFNHADRLDRQVLRIVSAAHNPSN